jgi:hypothetical protein
MDKLSVSTEVLENNAISASADADTFDIAVGTKAAIAVMIKIFLIIVIVVNHLIIVASFQDWKS